MKACPSSVGAGELHPPSWGMEFMMNFKMEPPWGRVDFIPKTPG